MGNALLEAGALGLPTVSTRATGARDASVDGHTGIQVAARSHTELGAALEKLIESPQLRRTMGEAGVMFVHKYFDKENVLRQLAHYYSEGSSVKNR
ncbi:hypothetical protein GCM10023190_22450 [Enteractinococcus fodinae]